jgi:hypothetical protein
LATPITNDDDTSDVPDLLTGDNHDDDDDDDVPDLLTGDNHDDDDDLPHAEDDQEPTYDIDTGVSRYDIRHIAATQSSDTILHRHCY